MINMQMQLKFDCTTYEHTFNFKINALRKLNLLILLLLSHVSFLLIDMPQQYFLRLSSICFLLPESEMRVGKSIPTGKIVVLGIVAIV